MNVFYLSSDPVEAARQQCDKHVVKMPIESAQMLSTAARTVLGERKVFMRPGGKEQVLYVLEGEKVELQTVHPQTGLELSLGRQRYIIANPLVMRVAHPNHPQTRWTAASQENYAWHLEHCRALFEEFEFRRGKKHASARVLPILSQVTSLGGARFVPPPLTMPDIYKDPQDAVSSYRTFYIEEKARFAAWTGREVPRWFLAGLAERGHSAEAGRFTRVHQGA